MFTDKQSAFVKRYVISAAPKLEGDLDALGRTERQQKVTWARDTILKGYQTWQDRLKGMKDRDPRDQLVNFAWMDRDAKGWKDLLAKSRAFQQSDDIAACEKAITRLAKQAEDGRMALKTRVVSDAERALGTEWPQLASRARSPEFTKSRKEMLQIIEEIEAGMAGMRRALELAGAAPEMVDKFKPELEKLRKSYDSSVPEFSGEVKNLPPIDDKVPELKYSDTVCLKIYDLCGRNWFELKKKYKTAAFLDEVTRHLDARPKDGAEVMWQLWAYRKKIVDDLIEKATKKFDVPGKGEGWVAVGSTNLESDYDLSVMQHGKKAEDWEVVDWFNKQFQSMFGTQPGIMFDTNLYASAPPIARMSDNPKTETEVAMAAMARSGQDVGALMKQRRFMSWEEYEDMMNEVLDEMEAAKTPPEIVKATRDQFEEADDRYQIAQARILERGETVLGDMIEEMGEAEAKASDPARAKRLKELLALQKDLARLKSAAENARGAEAAKLMLERAELLESAEDVILAVNNAIYVEATKESRELEKQAAENARKIEALKKELAELEKTDPKTPEDETAIDKKRKELSKEQEQFDGRTSRSKSLFADAVFFANEAYHSEGPFKHVVQATQAVDSDVEREFIAKIDKDENKKQGTGTGQEEWDKLGEKGQKDLIDAERVKRRDALSLHDCLQSFNEQLGDFIKDLHHHAADKSEDLPGTGFFRSSKYLDRLIDAVDLLDKKAQGGLGVPIPGKLKTLEEYRKALGSGLLALRKGKIAIDKQDADDAERQEQMEAFAIAEIRRLFGVSTLHDLGKIFKTFGSRVNAKLRAQVAAEMQAMDPSAYFK